MEAEQLGKAYPRVLAAVELYCAQNSSKPASTVARDGAGATHSPKLHHSKRADGPTFQRRQMRLSAQGPPQGPCCCCSLPSPEVVGAPSWPSLSVYHCLVA